MMEIDSIEQKKLDELSERLRKNEAGARSSRYHLMAISKLRFAVITNTATIEGDSPYWRFRAVSGLERVDRKTAEDAIYALNTRAAHPEDYAKGGYRHPGSNRHVRG